MEKMLYETQYGLPHMPIGIELMRIEEYPYHQHNVFEILYMLKGEIELKVASHDVTVTESHFFVINTNVLHYIKGRTSDDIALLIHINPAFFDAYYPNLADAIFICESTQPTESPHLFDEMRRILLQMADLYYANYNDKTGKLQSECISLLLRLTNNFQYWHMEGNSMRSTNIFKDRAFQLQRLHRIVDYVYKNHHRRLSLDTIAEEEHVNKYYISHLVSMGLGISFQEFLSNTRAEESLKYLYGTDMSIEEVSEKCGFSSVSFYRKSMLKLFGETPSTLRKVYRGKAIDAVSPKVEKYSSKDVPGTLRKLLPAHTGSGQSSDRIIRQLNIDFTEKAANGLFESPLRIRLTPSEELWSHSLGTRLEHAYRELGARTLALEFEHLKYYFDLMKSWDFVDRFIKDMAHNNFRLELYAEGDCPALNSFLSRVKDRLQVDLIMAPFTKKGYDSTCTTAEMIHAAMGSDGGELYLPLNTLVDKDNLKSSFYYAFCFLLQSKGQVVEKTQDSLTTKGTDTIAVLLNNKDNCPKDFILNFYNLNKPALLREYTINSERQVESEAWQTICNVASRNKEVLKAVKKLCEPRLDMVQVLPSMEQRFFYPLKPAETKLLLLNL